MDDAKEPFNKKGLLEELIGQTMCEYKRVSKG
jgi:hypothetical protein